MSSGVEIQEIESYLNEGFKKGFVGAKSDKGSIPSIFSIMDGNLQDKARPSQARFAYSATPKCPICDPSLTRDAMAAQ